jgi:hypothetical protein
MLRNAHAMTEPVSSSVGSYALMKFLPPLIGPVLATIVVMSIATPQSRKEWIAALTSTIAVSIFGGSFIVTYFGWTSWIEHPLGVGAIAGACFVSGLPAWLLVRALFSYMDKQRGKDIAEIAKDVAKNVSDIKDIVG